MKNMNETSTSINSQAPPPALPDAESARRAVGKWLRTEIGDALYPAEAKFLEESFAWHVSVWFSTARQPMVCLVADVYINAATGAFIGRPTSDEILHRLDMLAEL